jgi:hypothetical protein
MGQATAGAEQLRSPSGANRSAWPSSITVHSSPPDSHRARAGAPDRRVQTLGWMLLGAILLVLVQAGLGIVVNLYVTVPARHPGARAANYFVGSLHSVAWAITHGAAMLAIHSALGLALVVLVVGTAIHALRSGRRKVGGWSALAGLFVTGAGFNGASFLDFAYNINSLIMALLALAAIGCYATALMLLGTPSPSLDSETSELGR